MSIPLPPFTPDRYKAYIQSLSRVDFQEEVNHVNQDSFEIQNELCRLETEQPSRMAEAALNLRQDIQEIYQKYKLLKAQELLWEFRDIYRKSSLEVLKAAIFTTECTIEQIYTRNQGQKVFPKEEFEQLEQQMELLNLLKKEWNSRH